MKKTKQNFFMLLSVGVLLMNGPDLINLILHSNIINIDVIDFMRGMGLPIILWGVLNIKKIKEAI